MLLRSFLRFIILFSISLIIVISASSTGRSPTIVPSPAPTSVPQSSANMGPLKTSASSSSKPAVIKKEDDLEAPDGFLEEAEAHAGPRLVGVSSLQLSFSSLISTSSISLSPSLHRGSLSAAVM